MARTLAVDEKPLDWIGSSKRDFLAFPERVKDDMGNALGVAQFGGRHPAAKPWKGQGPLSRITRPAMARRRVEARGAITRGTTNVFADLGYADAEERQTKLRLAYAINQLVAERRLTQTGAASALGINQPKVSALQRYKLEGFSVERLMTFLTALGQDIEIVIRKKPRSRPAARITVVAA